MKGLGMGRLVILTIGIALGITAAVLVAAYTDRNASAGASESGA